VAVTTSTSGASPDADGYTVTLDGGASQSIAINQTVTFTDVSVGSHTAVLSGIAANCTVTGGTSRTVNVTAGNTATASFSVSCPTPPPTTGDLTVTTTTGGSGGLDPDGYTVAVDGARQAITINGSVTFNGLSAGNHSVGLTGVATTCVVSGLNPRTVNVPAGGTQQTNFAITCTAPANLPPIAAFTPSCNQLDCSFTSTSSDPDGVITSQQWTFGDGATGSGVNPSHHYAAAGTRTVTLTVTDDRGATGVVSHDVTVTEPPPPPPNQPPVVTAGGNESVLVGLLYTLGGASFRDPDHDGPWSVTIDWGDGSSSPSTATSEGSIGGSHSYPVTLLGADYTLTVTVVDAHGARASASKTVHVTVL
jgi:PKD repeat protein